MNNLLKHIRQARANSRQDPTEINKNIIPSAQRNNECRKSIFVALSEYAEQRKENTNNLISSVYEQY